MVFCFNPRNQCGYTYRKLEKISCSKWYTGTTKSKAFQPVLKSFRSEFKSMNFEVEAEKLSSEMFIKKSLIVKKRKATKPQTQNDDDLLSTKASKEVKCQKNHGRIYFGRKKLARNIVLKHKN